MTSASTRITPRRALRVLSQQEVNKLKDSSSGGLHEIFKRCAFAVLNSGANTDDCFASQNEYDNFDIQVAQLERGIALDLVNAPAQAFVDGELIFGIREHLFAVLRDIIYTQDVVIESNRFDLSDGDHITNAVFHILRNAKVLKYNRLPNLVVCWGGHSINNDEYKYTKNVGYELGLRGFDVGTGCGPGAMKGPMKGATIGHAKQHNKEGRYLGITEPSIIAAEAPNPIVNELVILPDIEKRLEAFVRLAHGIIVFPGGAGTAEEILYLLGILLHPDNANIPFPVVFTGPRSAAAYFEQINHFIGDCLGKEAQSKYTIIIDDPNAVARYMRENIQQVEAFRKRENDAFFYNWILTIQKEFQMPFIPTHENMNKLVLSKNQPIHQLAANLRQAFSGIVAGNVKKEGIMAVRKNGPFQLHGDKEVIAPMEQLLEAMVAQQRMKLPGSHYEPCYKIVQK
jgi:predicted Rossmann-fold nucleotide-binding protein